MAQQSEKYLLYFTFVKGGLSLCLAYAALPSSAGLFSQGERKGGCSQQACLPSYLTFGLKDRMRRTVALT